MVQLRGRLEEFFDLPCLELAPVAPLAPTEKNPVFTGVFVGPIFCGAEFWGQFQIGPSRTALEKWPQKSAHEQGVFVGWGQWG